ncbi:MAG: helix-hairpin-helix domain-containing protein [Myxococcota bacterium]
MVDQRAVAATLHELGRLLEATGAPVYRVRAHDRAARTIEALPNGDLERRVEEGRLEELPAIGPALARKLVQLVGVGTLPEIEALRAQVPAGFRELSRVDGLGPKRILALYQALGIADLDDLERAIDAQRLRTVKGFSPAAEERLRPKIAEARARQDRHLWLDAMREAERWTARLAASGATVVALAGDARRAREEVDGLSLVVVGAPVPAHAVGLDGLPVTLRSGSADGWPATLAWETGPDEHVATLRARAAARGLSLGPDGLFDAAGSGIPLADERALYDRLDLPWIPAELRDDPDAFDLGSDLDRIVRVEDVVGMVHCHSTWSDGRHTIAELAAACDAAGIAYLTITDHSRSAGYAGGLDADRLARQWDEIDEVQQRVEVVLLKGTESDILADGSLDFPDRVLEGLDVVIASVHQRHGLDPAAMTRRLIRAMRHPLYKIWGHGLGRLIGRRDPIACDVEAVLDAIADSRAAIEINSDPHRLDLPPEWLRSARRRRLRFVISSDAHSVGGLSVIPFGVGIARRAGILRDEVLNTLPVDAFRRVVRPSSSEG